MRKIPADTPEFKTKQKELRKLCHELDELKAKQTAEFMSVLDTKEYNDKSSQIKDNTNCTICMDVYQDRELVYEIPACKHFFHEECMRTWLMSKN